MLLPVSVQVVLFLVVFLIGRASEDRELFYIAATVSLAMMTELDLNIGKIETFVLDEQHRSNFPQYEKAVVQDKNTYPYDHFLKFGVTGAISGFQQDTFHLPALLQK
jgi:hypothetical protein